MTEEKPKKTQRKERAKKPPLTVQPSTPPAVQPSTPQVDESVVFVGNKPVMNYVLACMTCLNSGSNKIVVKARGRAIPRAVDTIEVLRRSFAKGVQLGDIILLTEEVAREQGQKQRVSAIEISVSKQ
jgi:DNA-binding protein